MRADPRVKAMHKPRGDPCTFVVCELGCAAYRLYYPTTHGVTISNDVVSVEFEFPALATAKEPSPALPAPAVELLIVAPVQDALRLAAPPP